MAILKCKMCGGDLLPDNDLSVCTCTFCGTKQTVPKLDNEKKLTLFSRANRLRALGEFDKAYTIYENIIKDFCEEPEAYWGLVLCEFGIEYVDDEKTGKKIPTCHRSSFDSIFDDPNFNMAIEYADTIARGIYREEAKAIEDLRKGILALSSEADKYDVFICYKEKDDKGERTIDSVMAQDVYDELCEKGLKVFFARISLEDKLGIEYEPYIFSALNSASVMLVFGTSYDNFHAVWVKNEWSRFLKLIERGEKKTLIPCFKDIDAYDMPSEFKHLQSQDMGKIGAVQDLVRGVLKLVSPTSEAKREDDTKKNDESLSNLQRLKRANELLKNGIYDKAKELFDMALLYEPYNENALLGMFLAENKAPSLTELSHSGIVFINSNSYKMLRGVENNELLSKLDKCVSDSIDFLIERGQGCLIADMFNEALIHFTSALKFDKHNEKALFGAFLANQEVEKLSLLESCNVNYTDDTYYKDLLLVASDETKAQLEACTLKTMEFNIQKGYEQLSKSNYPFAQSFFELALSFDNSDKDALIGILYCNLRVSSLDEIAKKRAIPSKSHWYERVIAVCDKEYKTKLDRAEAIAISHIEQRKRKVKIGIILGALALCLIIAICIIIGVSSSIKQAEYERSPAYSLNVREVEGGYEIGRINNSALIVDGVLEIPEYIDGKKVVGIGERAFYSKEELCKVVLPNSITYIGEQAFQFCKNLTEVTLSENLKKIHYSAFASTAICEINLPQGLEKIGVSSFSGTKLTTVTIPGSVNRIESEAFYNCPIETAIISEGVCFVDENAFGSIYELVVPSTVTYMQPDACLSVTRVSGHVINLSVVFASVSPSEVKVIGGNSIPSNLFANRTTIRKVILPENITSIQSYAFQNCSLLNDVTLSAGLKSIGSHAFANCKKLIYISLPNTTEQIDSFAFKGCNLTSIFIPSSVKVLGECIFAENTEIVIKCEIFQSQVPSTWATRWNLKSTMASSSYEVVWNSKN